MRRIALSTARIYTRCVRIIRPCDVLVMREGLFFSDTVMSEWMVNLVADNSLLSACLLAINTQGKSKGGAAIGVNAVS